MLKGSLSRHFPSASPRRLLPGRPLLIACAFTLAWPLLAFGTDDAARLEALRGRLQSLERSLDDSRDARDQARLALRDTERRIGATLRDLRQLNRSLRNETTKLERLRADAGARRAQLQAQGEDLTREARTAYLMGRQDYVKLLLNQEDPARVGRALVYYRYLTRARAQRIAHLRAGLTELNRVEAQIAARRQELAVLHDAEVRHKATLERARTERAVATRRLDQTVASQTQEIERLRRDEQRLTRVLGELRRYLPPPPALPGSAARFVEAKGRLALPVSAHARHLADGRRKGVFLSVPPGREVHAVFRGRVVYADWLPGFGLLLILEHGGGYMSLYGYNQSLYPAVGDWVEAGQTIALSGNSGGAPEAGLYFEIRHDGEPRDPLVWLKR